jgi:hypothetical protein
MEQLLIQLGINLSSSAIYELITNYFRSNPNPSINSLENFLASKLLIENASIKALTIINFMAKSGDLIIRGTNIYAPKEINMFSSKNTKLVFGNNSVSATDKSKIEASYGAQIISSGGAGIKQNEDGSISFFA